MLVNSAFPFILYLWIRIRIRNADPDPGTKNECGSDRIQIHITGYISADHKILKDTNIRSMADTAVKLFPFPMMVKW